MLDRKQQGKLKRKAQGQRSQEIPVKDEEVQQPKTDSEHMPPRRQLDLFHFYKKRHYETDAQSHLGHSTERVEPDADMQVSSFTSIDLKGNEAMDDNSSSSVDTVSLGHTLDKTDNDHREYASIGSDLHSTYSPRSANKPDAYVSLNTGLDTLANRTITTNAVVQKDSQHISLPTSPNIDAAMITAMPQRMNSSTDQDTTMSQENSYTSNITSISPFSSTLHPVDPEAPAKCAAPSSLSISLRFPVPQNSQFPLPSDESPSRSPPKSPSNTPIHLHSHPLHVHDQETRENNVTLRGVDESKTISMDLEARKCLDRTDSQDVNESLDPKEALLHATSASHSNTAIESVLSPISVLASEDVRILERTKSEHGSEKVLRLCDSLNEEASGSIRTTSQNVNANELGSGNVSSKNHSVHIPDTFLETGGDSATFIDLTDSPERGPPTDLSSLFRNSLKSKTYAQGNVFSNHASTDSVRYTTSATSHTVSMTSPMSGSQERPIELLSPVKGAAKSQSPPFLRSSGGPSVRESKRQSSEIHPFFQRIAKAAPLSIIDASRNIGRDAVLSMNLPDSNTAESAKPRVRVEKGKRNKDKTGYEAQCDNPKGVDDADVIFSHTTSEQKTHFRYLSSRSPNSIFGSGGSGVTNATGKSSSLRSVPSRAQTREAPWPNSENQHILPSQKSTTEKRCAFPKRRRVGSGYEGAEAETQSTLAERLGLNCNRICLDQQVAQSCLRKMGNSTIQNAIESISEEHRQHPGIARVISFIKKAEEKGSDKETEEETEVPFHYSMWTTKWKPRRAAEVLGNESHAVYLREWLKALSIQNREQVLSCAEGNTKGEVMDDNQSQKKKREKKSGETRGAKRPTVIRSITRKKRRRVGSSEDEDGDASWIVDDGDDVDEDEAESGRGIIGRDEDDWEPDEEKSTGDTSKDLKGEFSQRLTNTILLAGRPGTGKTSTVYACAAELGWEIFEVYPGIGKRTGMNIAALVGDVGKNHIVGKGIRQSIILLEEVDILFKEDTNFWTSVVNIISTSHRPVILTCNDASLVPQRDLPLQKCLNFEPCPCGLALSFLQVVCNAEGYDVTKTCVEEEYSLMGGDEPEWPPSIAFPSEALPSADLRSTLNSLQMGLKYPVSQEEYFQTLVEWEEGEHTLQNCELYAESASYIDAHLGWIEQLQKPGFETQGDDEIGYTMLTNGEECPSMGVQKDASSNYYSMACDALACCRHVARVPSRSKSQGQVSQTQAGHRWLVQTRRLLARQAASFLDELISLPGPLLPRQEALLEYIPVIRWLVALDDKDDPSRSPAVPPPRRRWRHVRYLDLSQEALRAIREYYDMFFPR